MDVESLIKPLFTFFGIILIALLLGFIKLSNDGKFKILIFSIYLILLEPFQKLHISYFNANEIVLQILAVNLLIYHKVVMKGLLYKLLISLTVLTLIAALSNNEIYIWFRYFFNPLSIFISIKFLATSEEKYWRLIRAIRNSMWGYVLLYLISYTFGSISGSDYFGEVLNKAISSLSIFGFGSPIISFHGFVFMLGSNQIAAYVAILVIISLISYLYSTSGKLVKTLHLAIVTLGLGEIVFSTGRAILIAVSISILITLFIAVKRKRLRVFVFFTIFFSSILLFGAKLVNQLTNIQLTRMLDLFSEGLNSRSSIYRLEFLDNTIKDAVIDIFGKGYNYYFLQQIDDAMLYSYIMNGSGLLSLVLFLLWSTTYLKDISNGIRNNLPEKPILILGLIVLINVLISGYSVVYLVGWRVYNVFVWFLLAISYNYYTYYYDKLKRIYRKNN